MSDRGRFSSRLSPRGVHLIRRVVAVHKDNLKTFPLVKLLRMKNILTTSEASEYLNVSAARIRKLINDGRLPAEKRGRDYSISLEDIENFATYGRKSIGRPKETAPCGTNGQGRQVC